jgi:hypothetical protein
MLQTIHRNVAVDVASYNTWSLSHQTVEISHNLATKITFEQCFVIVSEHVILFLNI